MSLQMQIELCVTVQHCTSPIKLKVCHLHKKRKYDTMIQCALCIEIATGSYDSELAPLWSDLLK